MRMEKHQRKSPVILIAALLIFGPAGTVSAATYYAAIDGSDSNPGTIGQPWRTIQHAADEIRAGDTVYIRGGRYNENISTTRSGSAGAYIVFSAYSGETPVIDGTGVSSHNNGFIVSHSYIKLSGLELCNWNNGNAIWAEKAGYLEISDCVVHDVEYGIGVSDGTHDFKLERVEIHHFLRYGFDASPSGGAVCYNGTLNDCIAHTWTDPSMGNECDGFAISHEREGHDFTFNRCEAHTVGDGFVPGGQNVTLNRCSAHDAEVGFKNWGDANFFNCLAYHNTDANVELNWVFPTTTRLQNCTLVDAGTYNIWVEKASNSLHMYNCIVSGSDNIGLCFEEHDVSNYRGDYNIFHDDDGGMAINVGYTDEFSLAQITAGDWTAYCGQDANSFVSTDPATQLFQNLSSWDLHLRAGSIAIDKGTSSGAPSVDYDGKPRPQGEGYDIGAYEYGAAPPVPTPTPAGPAPTPLSALIIDSGDYNGDGTSDIAIFRTMSGLWSVRGVTRIYFGGSSDRPVPGDYDDDGTTDIGIFRPSAGLWAVRGVTRSYFGSASDLPVPGDYNGDGNCDIGVFRESAGLWAIRGVTRAYFGTSGDTPVPGYYTGGGTKDIGLFRGSAGLWAIRGVTRTYFGGATDEVVPGDYNGDGFWDIGIFRPAAGLWAVRGVTRSYFGSSSDYPVPADYSGNGQDDIGIFRAGSGMWAVRGVTRVYFGSGSDIPVTR